MVDIVNADRFAACQVGISNPHLGLESSQALHTPCIGRKGEVVVLPVLRLEYIRELPRKAALIERKGDIA